jgi:hypothetical protein
MPGIVGQRVRQMAKVHRNMRYQKSGRTAKAMTPYWASLQANFCSHLDAFDFASGECLGAIARLPRLNGQALVFFP